MSDKPEEKKDEIPAFRITEKKVDDSWKEEMRREKLAAARAEQPQAPRETARPAAATPAPASAPEGGAVAKDEGSPPAKPAAKPAGTPQEQAQTKIFMSFLAGLAQQALMQLGEMENPYTGQAELDLQGARYTIELLNTILAKTKGNLTQEEEESLAGTIHDLKLRYVEIANEVQRQMAAQMQKGGPGGPAGPGGAMRPGPGGSIPGLGSGKRR